MKTTVEVSDALLNRAKRKARREGSSLRAVFEEGLRMVLDTDRTDTVRFRLRRVTYKGNGVVDGSDGLSWGRIREKIYEGRGA